jgi:site-specific DNA-methyltransferase (adenine-specific)
MSNETRSKQPDILEVIADLSNDEVFTPPRVANAVLDMLPDSVWHDPTLRWLDPGCKTGVFLREVTRRLLRGLADQFPDEQSCLAHILENMVFGIGVTELTALMSRRTLYCSKNAAGDHAAVTLDSSNGNVWFDRVEHSYDSQGRCTECGTSSSLMERPNRENYAYAFIHLNGRKKIEEVIGMKFDVIVGNPPYQMDADASGKNVVAIYDRFVEQAISLNPSYITMVIPSRWMVGGRGLDEFRGRVLTDERLRVLVDFPNSAELFPSVDIKSGICYFLWDRDRPGTCAVTTRRGGESYGPTERRLDEFDVLVRDARAMPILKKVLAAGEPSLADMISTRDPFGPTLGSNFTNFRRTQQTGDVRLVMNQESSSVAVWASRTTATRNEHLIDEWKVLLPKAGPGNSGGHVIPDSVIGNGVVVPPPALCTATYLVVGPLPSEDAANAVAAYTRTRFARFLVSLRKPSQNTTADSYRWVPQLDWDRTWGDEALYERYALSAEEQAFIAEMIKERPE